MAFKTMVTKAGAQPDGAPGKLTELLVDAGGGGSKRMEAVLPLVYEELRAIASRQLGREHERYSLCTTGLVHDAYLKLVDDTRVSSRGRSYFFGAAAQAMRRIIVDHARSRSRQKRGGDVHFTLLDDKELAMGEALEQIIELDDALSQLRALSPRQEQIVECRVFGGLDVVEIAEALDISQSTVKRDWAVARAWLLRQFKRDGVTKGEGES